VKQRLEEMRDEDAARSPAARQWRTITHDQFLQLCEEAGDVSSPEHLLSYLHNTGIVFHRQGLFDDRIILDQGWALEPIYAVFHREKSVNKLQRQKGRFFRSDLAEWLWNEAGHSLAEQELFLSMMQSCGICFALRPAQPDKKIETEYIAPDFLPKRSEIAQDLALKWDADLPTKSANFDYPLLHPGLMPAITSKIGSEAGLSADYWRGGLFAYETETGSRALIEEEQLEGWQGRIRVSTQRGQAALLLKRLTALIEEEHGRMGMTPTAVRKTSTSAAAAVQYIYLEGIISTWRELRAKKRYLSQP
jgi:internalin A